MPLLRKKRQPETPPLKDPLLAVPQIPAEVEAKVDDEGCVQLRRRIIPKKGIGSWISGKLRFDKYKRINLDPIGSAFWAQIDGKQNLKQILSNLKREHDWEYDEARNAVLTFTSELMKRGLVILDIQAAKA